MTGKMEYFVGLNQLAWLLMALILLSYLLPSIISPDQAWLIHPIILAHQATFLTTRKQFETPTITNSGATPFLVSILIGFCPPGPCPVAGNSVFFALFFSCPQLLIVWLSLCPISYLNPKENYFKLISIQSL
jgi:hypothetical protein